MTKIQELAERAKSIAYEITSPDATRTKFTLLVGIIDELAGIADAGQVLNTPDNIPPDIGEGHSDDYLIDLNGWRRDFAIGHYDHVNGRWIIHDDDARALFEPEHMVYRRLPLAKYDV